MKANSKMQRVAERMGLGREYLHPWGPGVARVDLSALGPVRSSARYILMSGITPRGSGDGKTTVAIGLAQALQNAGVKAVATLRQSSMGPTFGRKGGGAGGGRCQIMPFERALLHLTGDIHVVGQAHNLLTALVDNHIHHGNEACIAPDHVELRRVVDVNDRYLRHLELHSGGHRRKGGFEITAASELMAILALVDGETPPELMAELRARVGRMVVGFDLEGRPVTADDVQAGGAVTATLLAALQPNLLQTTEGAPVLLHTGPFANIAHGCSSVIADRIALRHAELVITEAGFGMDIGGEKFFDIKCRQSGFWPEMVVLVCTVESVHRHGTGADDPLTAGCANLGHHIALARRFGRDVIVAVNRHAADTHDEIRTLIDFACENGALTAVQTTCFSEGGAGAEDLAEAILAHEPAEPRQEKTYLYPLNAPLLDKMNNIARGAYQAGKIQLSEQAEAEVSALETAGFGTLPVCIAKTPWSLTGNPDRFGVPRNHTLDVHQVKVSAGAGFVYALSGRIFTMPGMDADPLAHHIDVDVQTGAVTGLS